MPNGSLRDLLQANAAALPMPGSSSSKIKINEKTLEEGNREKKTLPLKMALGFARDVAAGMLYLSSLGIVHRDLASRNILLKEDLDDEQHRRFVAKVSDFGLSRIVTPQEGYYRSASGLMPIQWSAPEALRHKRFSTKTDVWSYGVLLWEIFSGGEEPYDGLTGPELRSYVESGGRLSKPRACPDSIYAFMRRCWAADSTDRPSFKEIFDFVDSQFNSAQDITDEDFFEIHSILYPDQQGQETQIQTANKGKGSMSVLNLNFINAEKTLQELYHQSMGKKDPLLTLNFAIALLQMGDLPGAYGTVAELLSNATPDPTEKIWASVFFVRGSLNTRLGDFYAAGKDFSQAVSFMRALSLSTINIPHVKTVPEGRFKTLFPPNVSISDVGCAAGNAFFYHAITGTIPDEERIRIFAMTEGTFTQALAQKNSQRGNVFFNLGQIYYCHSVYAHDILAQNSLLVQALDCYASALPIVPKELQADIHIMKAKALARLGRSADANAAIEASIKIDPIQSIPDLKSPRELMAQPEVPEGIVCGKKSEHDFQKFNTFAITTLCCNYCGRIQLFQKALYRCTRCGYTVHTQCLPYVKFFYCYGSNVDNFPIINAIRESRSACKGVHVNKPPVDRNCDSDDELDKTEKVHESRRRSVSSGNHPGGSIISEGIQEEKARNSKVCSTLGREKYVITHVHALRPGVPYFENCHKCSKAFRIGDKSMRCVKCRKVFHVSCLNSKELYIELHPAEFPSLNASAIQVCGFNSMLYWPQNTQ